MTREGYQIQRRDKLENCLVELHALLDMCYPKPPRDVFYRLTEQYRPGFPAWFARDERNQLVGFVYLRRIAKVEPWRLWRFILIIVALESRRIWLKNYWKPPRGHFPDNTDTEIFCSFRFSTRVFLAR